MLKQQFMITSRNVEALRGNITRRIEEIKKELEEKNGVFCDGYAEKLYNMHAILLELDASAEFNDVLLEVERKRAAHFDTWERLMTEQNRHLADTAHTLADIAHTLRRKVFG